MTKQSLPIPGDLISRTISFVQEALKGAEGGHDWSHTERVWRMAKLLWEQEGRGDILVIELAALLHDIADAKFHGGDLEKGALLAYEFLQNAGLDEERVQYVHEIIRNISYKGGGIQQDGETPDGEPPDGEPPDGEPPDGKPPDGKPPDGEPPDGKPQDEIRIIEFHIVQDADRLDAMGAIGIARAFNYGGFRNRPIYDPLIPVREYNDPDAYYRSGAPTINHFYEKLLRLKDLMNTFTGREIAEGRHRYMLEFLERFFHEWDFRKESSG